VNVDFFAFSVAYLAARNNEYSVDNNDSKQIKANCEWDICRINRFCDR